MMASFQSKLNDIFEYKINDKNVESAVLSEINLDKDQILI